MYFLFIFLYGKSILYKYYRSQEVIAIMDTVLGKLSEIEAAAKQILDNANSQKENLSKKMEQKTILFDKELEQSTARTLASMQEETAASIQEQLVKLQADADEVLHALEQDYNKNHTIYANNILLKLTGA